jgi:hypothetical protein
MTELDLRETIARHLDTLDVPPPALGPVVMKGRRRHRRRRAVIGASVAAAVAAVATSGAALVLSDEDGQAVDDTSRYASLGPLDFSRGARAYADPGGELHLAGRTFPYGDLEYLDTDAVATAYGMVFFDRSRPMLLGADGEVRRLVDGPVDDPEGFHPTAKLDSVHPWVAYATRLGITTTVTVHDLSTGRDVASTTIDCGDCSDFVIEALDDGVVYLRIDQLTRSWDVVTGEGQTVYDGGGRVVDVRGGVMLYDGKPPADLGLTRVKASIDAQLTFDGRYVLDWSSRLRSTDGSPDLVLGQGPTDDQGDLAFWAFDSDGSVLVARADGKYPNYLVYDCEVPSGACEELGPLRTTGGDPLFIGVDM